MTAWQRLGQTFLPFCLETNRAIFVPKANRVDLHCLLTDFCLSLVTETTPKISPNLRGTERKWPSPTRKGLWATITNLGVWPWSPWKGEEKTAGAGNVAGLYMSCPYASVGTNFRLRVGSWDFPTWNIVVSMLITPESWMAGPRGKVISQQSSIFLLYWFTSSVLTFCYQVLLSSATIGTWCVSQNTAENNTIKCCEVP